MSFLTAIPSVALLAGALASAIGLVCLGQILVHRRFRRRSLIEHNDVGGVIIVVAGTLYAVVLGFFTVIAWQHYQEAREIVEAESNADIDAWHTAAGLPPVVRERVRSDMLTYANVIIEREWPAMRRGTLDPELAFIGMDAIDVTAAFTPVNQAEANAQAATMQQLTIIHDARQRRIGANRNGITWFEWLILTVGAVCIVCFCWLFGLRSERIHLLMTATVVTIIVSTMVLLFELQYPFRSDAGVDSGAWQYAIAHIHEMQSGPLADMRM
jgi:hypothetical protein